MVKKVHILYIKSDSEQIQENKKTIFEGVDINGETKFVWGLPKSGRWGENTRLIKAWKELETDDYLIILDEKNKKIYLSSITYKQESEDIAKQIWRNRKFSLIFFFTKPVLFREIDNSILEKLTKIDTLLPYSRVTDLPTELKSIISEVREYNESASNVSSQENIQDIINNIYLFSCLKQIILYGPPGTGKTHLAKSIAENITDKENIKIIQFHPSYTYEDFVRGIEVKTINGQPVYETKNKIFAQMCEIARPYPDKKYILIIDEINRANLSAVLGELIYALEYRGEPVETPYEINGNKTLIIPDNLYIIGTMNTADRSVGHIDYAIRRRFLFYPVRVNKNMIDNKKAKYLYENIIEKIFKEDNMSSEFRDKVEDVKIGHTYFMGDVEDVAYKFVYQVIPLLVEYIRDGILKSEEVVKDVIRNFFGSEEGNWKELRIEKVKQKLQQQN